jgi:hypothetical protein
VIFAAPRCWTSTASCGVRHAVSCVTALTHRHTSLWTGLITALGIVLTLACSSGKSVDPGFDIDQMSPAEIISRSSAALPGITTFRFGLAHDNGNTILSNGIAVSNASGTVLVPGRYTLDADMLVSGFFVNTAVTVINQDSYMTHPITGRWQLLEPGTSPFGTFNPVSLVSSILEQFENPHIAPAQASKVGSYVIDGHLPAIALKSLTSDVDETAPRLNVRMTIDGSSLYPVEALITGRVTTAESGDLVRTVRLFEFNADISIEPPI